MAEKYTLDYIEQSFYCWYENGKVFSRDLLDKLPKTEQGNSPNVMTLKKWADDNGWIERADALDAEVSAKMDDTIINKRIAMYEKHAKIGDELIEEGRDFLAKQGGGLKTENAALRAIELGIDITRKSVGVADYIKKLDNMTPEQLDAELQKLIGTPKESEFIVDGVTKEEENSAGV